MIAITTSSSISVKPGVQDWGPALRNGRRTLSELLHSGFGAKAFDDLVPLVKYVAVPVDIAGWMNCSQIRIQP